MRISLITLLVIFCCTSLSSVAQYNSRRTKKTSTTAKGSAFVYWGYNRSIYTKSDLRILGQGYDLTLKGATASDNPYPFSMKNYFSIQRITVPQFNLRMGYYFKDNWAISLGYDHLKYVFDNGNQVQLYGHIDAGKDTVTNLSGDYNGEEFTTDRETFHYENSDGLNYIRVEVTHSMELFSVGKKNQFAAVWNAGLGVGTIMSVNDFNFMGQFDRTTRSISGYGISAHTGVRFEFFRHFFLQPNISGGMLHQLHVRNRPNDLNAYSKQIFGYSEINLVAGVNFRIKGKKDCDCPKW
jgi:hypothetical protein